MQSDAGAVTHHPKVSLGNIDDGADLLGGEIVQLAQKDNAGHFSREFGNAAVKDFPEFGVEQVFFRRPPFDRFEFFLPFAAVEAGLLEWVGQRFSGGGFHSLSGEVFGAEQIDEVVFEDGEQPAFFGDLAFESGA